MKTVVVLLVFIFTISETNAQYKTTDSLRPEIENADTNPHFKGGVDSMTLFLQNHLTYPESAIKNNLSRIIYIQFIVNLDGSISEVKPQKNYRSKYEVLVQEAIRVVKLSNGMWLPAIRKGKAVRAICLIPITFVLE